MKTLRLFYNRRPDPPFMPNSRRFCYSLLVVLLAWILPSCSSRSIQRSAENVPEDVWSYANRLLPMPTQKADACGGRSRHQLNGTITSPGFPASFSPLRKPCSWTIERGDSEGITLYLFELYLSRPGGLRVVAYDSDPDRVWTTGQVSLFSLEAETDFGTFSRESSANNFVVRTRKPYLRITVISEDAAAHHSSSILDEELHGFNLTFVITPPFNAPQEHFSACRSHTDCSRLGRCLTSYSLTSTWCQCFEGHYGHMCQYGPMCDPDANFPVNPCHNGGRCWYPRPEVVKCNCQANFGGELCKEDKRKIRAISSALPGSKTDKPCHYVLRKLRGQIHSPNFPGVFSVPVKCEWVIVTDRKTDTAIHFTESYLQDPAEVRISSFDFYENGNGTNEKVWGDENYQHAFDFQSYPEKLLVISQPYIVIRMLVKSLKDMVRVKRYLLDRTGFNYTYVTFPRGSQPSLKVNCTGAFGCKWAGICSVNQEFTSSTCECFPGQTGDNCQHGVLCNPLAKPPVNPCFNGASCEYFFGTELVRCGNCPPGFAGHLCESTTTSTKFADECRKLECDHRCIRNGKTGKMQCGCEPGFSLMSDGRRCLDTNRTRVKVDIELRHEMHPDAFVLPSILGSLGNPKFEGCKKVEWTGKVLSFICLADSVVVDNFRRWLQNNSVLVKGKPVDSVEVSIYPILDMKSLVLYSVQPTKQGKEMALVCLAHGSTSLEFVWKKDDVVFNPRKASGMWVTEQTLMNGSSSMQINMENVGRPHQGVYTCAAEDFGEVVSQSLFVHVLRPPTVNIVPPTPAVQRGQTLLLNCMASHGNTTYKWTRRNEDVRSLRADHNLTDIQERTGRKGGMQLIIDHVDHNTEYRCTASNAAGTSSKVVKVRELLPSDHLCPDEVYQGISWTKSRAETHNEQLCPVAMNGTVSRKCNKMVQWEEPDYAGCATVEVMQYKTNLEMIQRGFGQSDFPTLMNYVQILLQFVNKNRPMYKKDIATIDTALKEVNRMALAASIDNEQQLRDVIDETFTVLKKELQARAMKGDLDVDDLLEKPVDKVEMDVVGNDGLHTFILSGKLECISADLQQNVSETKDTDVSRTNFTCPVLPLAAETPVPSWVNVAMSLSMQDWPSSSDISNALEFGLNVNQTKKDEIKPGGIVSNVMDFFLHKYDPTEVGYLVNMTFSNIINVNESQHHDETVATTDDQHECVQKEKLLDDWSVGFCKTLHNRSDGKEAGLRRRKRSPVVVRCLCGLSSSRTIFAVRTVTNSSSISSPIGSSAPLHPALVPVIVVGFVLTAIVCVALLIFRRKKFLTCLLAVKKRTCDIFAHNLSSHEAPVEIPLSPCATNRLSGTNVPVRDPDESTMLVDHRGRVVTVDSNV